MREARDVQTLAEWFAALESWDLTLGQSKDESGVAAAIVRRLDGDDLLIDGEEWYSEAPAGDGYGADELFLEGPPGREARIRVRVELVEGEPT